MNCPKCKILMGEIGSNAWECPKCKNQWGKLLLEVIDMIGGYDTLEQRLKVWGRWYTLPKVTQDRIKTGRYDK